MTEINPNNYPGANITIVGRAGGTYEIREFPSGGEQAELSIAVGKGYKNRESGEWVDTGTDWYTLIASPKWAEENWPEIGPGDTVRVDDGRLETRTYLNKDKEPRADLQVRFGTLVVVQAKADKPAAKSNDTPF